VRGKCSCTLNWSGTAANNSIVLRGLVPRIHVFVSAAQGVDAHGSSPWAEGPRHKAGQDEIGGAMFPPSSLRYFPRTAPREGANAGISVTCSWVPAFSDKSSDSLLRGGDGQLWQGCD